MALNLAPLWQYSLARRRGRASCPARNRHVLRPLQQMQLRKGQLSSGRSGRLDCAKGNSGRRVLRERGTVQPFAELLSGYLERPGVKQSEVAERAGIDPGTITKLKKGQGTTRETVIRLARALQLSARETDLLVAAAQYLPPSLAEADDEALELTLELCRLLTGPVLPAEERQTVRRFLVLFLRLAHAGDPPTVPVLAEAGAPLRELDKY